MTSLAAAAPSFLTYACRADHHRLLPVESRFESTVPMVRVELRERETPAFSTPLGEVLPSDHLLYSVEDVRERFGARLARPIARVELITPARRAGTRFSPIALFLGYERVEDRSPSFFIVEAGTAAGTAEVLYLGERMDSELRYPTGYHPTPYTQKEQLYRSRLRMAGPAEPGELVVEASHPGASAPHLRITARFERELREEEAPLPARQTAEAALRVMAVGRAIDRAPLGFVGRLLGRVGSALLSWKAHPEPSGAPAATEEQGTRIPPERACPRDLAAYRRERLARSERSEEEPEERPSLPPPPARLAA